MAFTQEQLTALESSIALGALEVQYTDRKVKYHSLSEMMRLRDAMRAELGHSGAGQIAASYPTFAKGF